jgi:hypothetical protein
MFKTRLKKQCGVEHPSDRLKCGTFFFGALNGGNIIAIC